MGKAAEIRTKLLELPTCDPDFVRLVIELAEVVETLEGAVLRAERIANKTASDASCRANGIIPD